MSKEQEKLNRLLKKKYKTNLDWGIIEGLAGYIADLKPKKHKIK